MLLLRHILSDGGVIRRRKMLTYSPYAARFLLLMPCPQINSTTLKACYWGLRLLKRQKSADVGKFVLILEVLLLCLIKILQGHVVYFRSVEFFKQQYVYGVRCQCSGVRFQEFGSWHAENTKRHRVCACDRIWFFSSSSSCSSSWISILIRRRDEDEYEDEYDDEGGNCRFPVWRGKTPIWPLSSDTWHLKPET